jgi:hypothetical protein
VHGFTADAAPGNSVKDTIGPDSPDNAVSTIRQVYAAIGRDFDIVEAVESSVGSLFSPQIGSGLCSETGRP